MAIFNILLVQDARHGQRKWRNGGFEADAVVSCHAVTALHRAYRGFQDGTAGITEFFARIEMRLLTYHAIAADFLNFPIGIGDDPVTAQKLCRNVTEVRNRNRIGEDVAPDLRLGLIDDIIGRYFDSDITIVSIHA